MCEASDPSLVERGDEMTLLCSSLLGAVGRGHFVITIFKNQIIWIVEMGWMGALAGCCAVHEEGFGRQDRRADFRRDPGQQTFPGRAGCIAWLAHGGSRGGLSQAWAASAPGSSKTLAVPPAHKNSHHQYPGDD